MDATASPNARTGADGHWTPYFVSSDTQETREIVGQNITAHTLEHKSPLKRPVTVRFRTASLGTLTFHEMAYSMFGEGEATIHAPKMANIYLCEINLAGEMAVGRETATMPFRPGEIYMINANTPHAKIWRTDGRQMMIKIHQTDMEAALERLIGMPAGQPLRFEAAPQKISGAADTLRNMIDLLGRDLENPDSLFAGLDGAAVARMVVDLMLKALPNNYSHLLANPSPIVRPRQVRFAAEYIHANATNRIRLDDLVAASGVSKRSLHAGFRRYYGVPPMIYLRNVRLDLARLKLSGAGGGGATVTDIALDCGFTHLSKFARAYSERFGELPSQTLRNT